MRTSLELEQKLKILCEKGVILPRTENNQYLKISYKGNGTDLSHKWNVKIYTSGSVVCNDPKILSDILNDTLVAPDTGLAVLQIDDAGIGFPLCGCIITIYDGTKTEWDSIGVKNFQGQSFEKKAYLNAYASKGWDIIQNRFHATPQTHRIEICSGYINKNLKELLRKKDFDVRITEIMGFLQDEGEKIFKEYIRQELHADLAYDPKELMGKEKGGVLVSREYNKVLEWGRKNAPHLLKTGWKSIQELSSAV